MKKLLLVFLISILSPLAFSQVTVDCKVSSTYELVASYNNSQNSVLVTKVENGVSSDYVGTSFQQLSKTSLNQNQDILALAKSVGIDVTRANAANIFILQQSSTSKTELVDFISVDAQSLGVAAVIGASTQICQ